MEVRVSLGPMQKRGGKPESFSAADAAIFRRVAMRLMDQNKWSQAELARQMSAVGLGSIRQQSITNLAGTGRCNLPTATKLSRVAGYPNHIALIDAESDRKVPFAHEKSGTATLPGDRFTSRANAIRSVRAATLSMPQAPIERAIARVIDLSDKSLADKSPTYWALKTLRECVVELEQQYEREIKSR